MSGTELRSALLSGWHGYPPNLLGGAPAPRAAPRGAKRCLDKGPCLGDEAQDVTNTPWTPRQKPELDCPQAHEHPASVLAASAPVPCIYSFNNNRSHLFIPFRKGPCFGHLSGVFCCFYSSCHAPACACLTCHPRGAVCVLCPHMGTGVFV